MAQLRVTPHHSPAWIVQTVLSFVVSLVVLLIGVAWLPVDGWMRAFLAMGVLYVTTSAISLAKTVRDQFEGEQLLSRIDEAKTERLLYEYDPLKPPQ